MEKDPPSVAQLRSSLQSALPMRSPTDAPPKTFGFRRPSTVPLDDCDTPDDRNDLDEKSLMEWWEKVHPWPHFLKDQTSTWMTEEKIFTMKADRIHNAMQLHQLLLAKHGETLRSHIEDLYCIADNLDKVSKGTKIAGITGGAVGAVGGVAMVAGVLFAPVTFGASLALTAVGVGVTAAGGATGATAAITNKVNLTQDKKRIENNHIEYSRLMSSLDSVLKFINDGWEQLRQHDLYSLQGVSVKSFNVARQQEVVGVEAISSALEANRKASGLMEGFALGIFDTTGNKEPALKKGMASKLAVKIRGLSEQMKHGLDAHMRIKWVLNK